MTTQLITEWSSPDPRLAEMLRGIAAPPEHSPARLAAEAALHAWQAQHCHELIGKFEIERLQSQRARRGAQSRRTS